MKNLVNLPSRKKAKTGVTTLVRKGPIETVKGREGGDIRG